MKHILLLIFLSSQLIGINFDALAKTRDSQSQLKRVSKRLGKKSWQKHWNLSIVSPEDINNIRNMVIDEMTDEQLQSDTLIFIENYDILSNSYAYVFLYDSNSQQLESYYSPKTSLRNSKMSGHTIRRENDTSSDSYRSATYLKDLIITNEQDSLASNNTYNRAADSNSWYALVVRRVKNEYIPVFHTYLGDRIRKFDLENEKHWQKFQERLKEAHPQENGE